MREGAHLEIYRQNVYEYVSCLRMERNPVTPSRAIANRTRNHERIQEARAEDLHSQEEGEDLQHQLDR